MAANDPRYSFGPAVGARVGAPAVDQGLRAFMLAVYNHMALSVAITGAVALGVFLMAVDQQGGQFALTSFGQLLFRSPLRWVMILAPFVPVLWLSFGAERMSVSTARTLFYVYAALIGVSLSTVFLVYTGGSVARVFFVSAASFGALSLYGYTTKRDLSAMGAFLVMGLFGLILGSVVNMFLGSGPFELALTVAGVGIFAGLTAWDTQKLKLTYDTVRGSAEAEKVAIFGALNLYTDFLNLFLMLLRLLGDRR